MELDYVFSGSPFWARQSQNQGPTLDPQRNNLDFYKNSLNQNQQPFDSRYVAEESEEEDNQGFEIGSHEFENLPPGHRFFHGGVGALSQMKRSNLSSSVEDEYAPPRLGGKMGEIVQSQQQEHRRRQSRVGSRNSGGEIVEVQGGHIVRSTGRKDRHSKVCTSKGPRDRRVRLSAHTAIQFYDVQDRLGYDRPSKAVDWLIKKAKAAIDELAELPAWQPTTTATNSTSIFSFEQNPDHENTNHHELSRFDEQPNDGNLSLLPPSFNSDSIADTIKSFFPMGASSTSVNSNSTGMQFHQSFPQPDLLSNSNNQSQDLRLSLQSFRDPILQHHHHHQQQNEQDNSMFLDGSGWPERMVGWSGGGSGDAASGGFVFNSPPTQTPPFLQTLLSQTTNNQLFNNNSQRGPLQSSYTPSIRAWVDQPPFAGAIDHTSSMSGFTSGFSGFLIPARFQGEQEEHDGISDKPSSASSDSRH